MDDIITGGRQPQNNSCTTLELRLNNWEWILGRTVMKLLHMVKKNPQLFLATTHLKLIVNIWWNLNAWKKHHFQIENLCNCTWACVNVIYKTTGKYMGQRR